MKKQFLNIRSISVYATAIVTAALLSSSSVKASSSKSAKNANEAKISYVASKSDKATFNVLYNNEAEENFVVVLTDEMGQVLMQKKYSDKVFNKNFELKNVGEEAIVNFIIKTSKASYSQKFSIGTHIKTMEQVVVTPL